MDDFDVPLVDGPGIISEVDDEIVGYCRCGQSWTGEAICHCPTCHRSFGSITGFDRHRRGVVGMARCLTDDELIGAGLASDLDGIWRVPMDSETIDRIRG